MLICVSIESQTFYETSPSLWFNFKSKVFQKAYFCSLLLVGRHTWVLRGRIVIEFWLATRSHKIWLTIETKYESESETEKEALLSLYLNSDSICSITIVNVVSTSILSVPPFCYLASASRLPKNNWIVIDLQTNDRSLTQNEHTHSG